MTNKRINRYFTDFAIWAALNDGRYDLDSVKEWAASLVADGFISEEEEAELVVAAEEDATLYEEPVYTEDSNNDESAASLGTIPVSPLKKSFESFSEKVRAAVKSFYDSNSIMVEDCEGDILTLNNALDSLRRCTEDIENSLRSMNNALQYHKNEDAMKAIALLGDAIKELAGDDEEGDTEDEAGAPSDSLSSSVSAIYNDEPSLPDEAPNPAGEEPEPGI